jgi:hypothetical protein
MLVFPRRDGGHFTATNVRGRGLTAWKSANLSPITLHKARHAYASPMIGCERQGALDLPGS